MPSIKGVVGVDWRILEEYNLLWKNLLNKMFSSKKLLNEKS